MVCGRWQGEEMDERLKIFNVIDSKWEDIQCELKDTITNNIKENNSVLDEIKKVTSDYLTTYKESLKNSRILID